MVIATLMRRLSALACGVLTGWLAVACSPTRDASEATRYLYVVNCDARVDKLDTHARKKVDTFHLSERSGSPPAVPSAPDGKMDGCLAQRVLVDSAARQVRLVAPKEARLDSAGLQEFQLLTLSLPDWKLMDVRPAGKLPEAPQLQQDAAGDMRVLRDSEWTPVMQMDLGGYKGYDGATGNLIVASSGSVSLLSLLSAKSDRLALGLADQRTRAFTQLADLPPTTLRHVHLAPGGGFVLIEATEGTDTSAKRSGALRLYDASSKLVAEVADERVRGMTFVALTPNGMAAYRSGSEYYFVSFGHTFGNAAVTTPIPDPASPGLVFTAQ